ncbi:hypothetical protein H0H93_009824 [Arthromyces matolae]|nr:hypothetical protein H0H93_009824 [Arthromyces matolae]
MRMTRIFTSAALVYCLLIWGVVAQNHQVLAVQELGARSSHDKQASASNPITVDAELLEKLKGEMKDLLLEKSKVEQSLKGKDRQKRLNAVNDKIIHKRRYIQGVERGFTTKPTRLLDGNRPKLSNHPSISERTDTIKRLEEEVKGEQDPEKSARLQWRLSSARFRLRQEEMMEKVENREDPGALAGTSCNQTKRKTPETRMKEIAAVDIEITKEKDPAQLKKLRRKLRNLKYKMGKAKEKDQQSPHKPQNGNEKADESEVGATAENLDSCGVQLGGGLGEVENFSDAGCFKEDFDLYLWGQECNGQDL